MDDFNGPQSAIVEIDKMEKVAKAFVVANRVYEGKLRKISGLPYITHLFDVMLVLRHQEADILAASLLANLLDDCPEYSYEKLAFDFNGNIASLVKEMSDDNKKVIDIQEDPVSRWLRRKKLFLKDFPRKTETAKLIITAKHICNLFSLLRDYQNQGEVVWEKLGLPQKEMWWYYKKFFEVLTADFHHAIAGDYYNIFVEAEKVFSPKKKQIIRRRRQAAEHISSGPTV